MAHYQLNTIPMKKENNISFGFRFWCPKVIFVKLLEKKRERKNPQKTLKLDKEIIYDILGE